MTDAQIVEMWVYYSASTQPVLTIFDACQRGSREDYLAGVEVFAGDYLTTPFSFAVTLSLLEFHRNSLSFNELRLRLLISGFLQEAAGAWFEPSRRSYIFQ
jgi:DNA-binding response OmpR family regulator